MLPPWALQRDRGGRGLFAMEFHAWSLLEGLKKGCNRWNEAAESIKARALLLCSSSKYGGLSFCAFPMPLSLGPGLGSIPEERVVLGRLCVLGKVEKAPSDAIAKGCSGTVSLPGSSRAVCEQGSPIYKKTIQI